MQPDLEVDERLLQSVAKSVDTTAAGLHAAVRAAGSGLTPPAGSTAAEAARTAEQAWLAELGGLHDDTEALAVNLAAAATSFRASDEAGAHALRTAGNGLPR